FARAIPRADGQRPLYWQTLSRSMDLSMTSVAPVIWKKDKYTTGHPLDLNLFKDQLFGFVWGDWTQSGSESLAVLEHGDRIRIYAKDLKWKTNDVYGGTKNDFVYSQVNSITNNGSFLPRLITWRPAKSDRDQMLVPTNFSELGVRFQNLKIY